MAINKLVDHGEVYVIGQYEIGTSNPTSLYKIGIVQNDRSTESRVDEHQTGNPNRLFIAAKIPSEASYMVEQQMHKTWNSVRVGQEWFNLSNATDLAKVTGEIHALEALYGRWRRPRRRRLASRRGRRRVRRKSFLGLLSGL